MKFPQYRQEAVKDFLLYKSNIVPSKTAEASEHLDEYVRVFSDRNIPSFVLPDNGEIVKFDTECEMTMDNFHMPFRQCFLEYKYSAEYHSNMNPNEDKFAPESVIILVEHHEEAKQMRLTPFFKTTTAGRPNSISNKSMFHPTFLSVMFRPESKIKVTKKGVRMEGVNPGMIDTPITRGISVEEIKQMMSEFADEVRAVVHFAMLSACANVKPQKVFTPSSTALEWARDKRRSPPSDYWVLDVYMNDQEEKETTSGTRTGGHAPPRFHVRRGHVRVLATGKSTWVRQTTVGNPELGRVDKDYRVKVAS
jgi:hypothetical protein